jgi:DNA repair photolyase
MAKPRYEGYCGSDIPTQLVKEKFGDISVYSQNAKSVLNKATGFIGAYDFTLNPYRGCQYGCSYCYAAAFSPNPRMRQDWGKWVIIKENAAIVLEKELEAWYRKNPNKPPSIYMSSVTDPYQPIESQYHLTRRLLEVMVDYRPTLVIQTRSPIITRDIDFLQRFQRLRINMSIPTGSESVRKDFEPRSPSIKARFNAVQKIKKNIDPLKGFVPKLSITITPLLPTLTADEADFIARLKIADRVVYIAWFLIYQAGLLPTNIKILDIAAGPATVAYGLALFLHSTSGFFQIPQMHISYYSLEKQDGFQFRGLQFWRRYVESRNTPVNAYFRFVTTDLLTWNSQSSNLPKAFFDFIVVSHCFFADSVKRIQANNTYKEIFATSLKDDGYALLIVQDKKLFKTYDTYQGEDYAQEKKLVNKMISELGLELVWYKYLTSTDSRSPLTSAEFAKFADEKLPKQVYMSQILQKYLGQKYQSHYTLDDYVILARKA